MKTISTRPIRAVMAAAVGLLLTMVGGAALIAQTKTAAPPAIKPPLSIEQALQVSQYLGFALSPDGEWLAYAYDDTTTDKTRLRLLQIATGREIALGSATAETVDASWSPNSQWMAFHSDETGTPQVWVWDRAREQAHAVPDTELFGVGWTAPRWFPDSRRFVTQLWPKGDARPPKKETPDAKSPFRPPFKPVASDQLSVYVHRANLDPKTPEPSSSTAASGATATSVTGADARMDITRDACDRPPFGRCDLAIVDAQTSAVTRVVKKAVLSWFQAPSPDGRFLAYATLTGTSIATQLQYYDLHVIDVATGQDRLIAKDLNTYGGVTMAWSPDSTRIAHLSLRAKWEGEGDRYKVTPGDLAIVPIDGSGQRVYADKSVPVLYGREEPLWSRDGQRLYGMSVDRQLVELDLRTGTGRMVTAVTGQRIKRIVTPHDWPALWSPTGDDRVLIEVENKAASTSGISELNIKTGAITKRLERFEQMFWSSASATGRLVYLAARQESPGDLWLWQPTQSEPTRLGSLNAFLDRVALGKSQRLTWRTADGRDLAGALLLPANYQPGMRVPLFVWIYGGQMGSEQLHKFGFAAGAGIAAYNHQILASRGYAVLQPDAPQRMGTPLMDLVEDVMPGVDAAIAQGFVDPDRLAIGGHSYGSYSTMAIITHTTRFKAAIISGVLDMNLESVYFKMSNTGVSDERWSETGQGLMGGTPWQYPDRFRENSPIHLFDKIQTPVLIGQGELDTATPITGANATFVALRRLGKPVEYRIYEGDGHAFHRNAHVIDFWNRRLEFLSEHLDIALDAQGRVLMDHGRARPRAQASAAAGNYR
jgi:dipeptidyl aminopeptidase/acylaminoacyl peptidase